MTLTIPQAARRIGMSARDLRQAVDDGLIEFVTAHDRAKRRRITEEALTRYLANRATTIPGTGYLTGYLAPRTDTKRDKNTRIPLYSGAGKQG